MGTVGDFVYWDKITLSMSDIIQKLDVDANGKFFGQISIDCNLSDLNSRQLSFGCYINVLEISYNANDKILKNFKTRMNICSSYKFEIDEYTFQYIANPHPLNILYSPNFDNETWCLKVVPFTSDYKHSVLMLKILRLPNKIKKIVIKYQLKIDFGDDSKIVSGQSMILPFKALHLCKYPSHISHNYKSLSFLINIQLIEVYDLQYNKIDMDNWSQYDIIDTNDNKFKHDIRNEIIPKKSKKRKKKNKSCLLM